MTRLRSLAVDAAALVIASVTEITLHTLALDGQHKRHWPDPLHPLHRHDVGRTRAPDRTALDDRHYRNEAHAMARSRAN